MHNSDSVPDHSIKTDKELTIALLDGVKSSSEMNNFELRKLKQTVVKKNSVLEQSQVNLLNVTVNFPSYQFSARQARLKIGDISKFQTPLETSKADKSVFDGQKLTKEAVRGYYEFPFYNDPSRFQCLHPGATFKGFQNSGRVNYNVEIVIKDVQLDRSFLSGYIMIEGITQAYSTLTTFFDAELIGPHHDFLSRKWQTNEEIDKMHWMKFPSFRAFKYDQVMNMEKFQYDPRQNGDFLFFRFKEHFLVPDHKVQNIPGASFAGFYYICIQLSTQAIEGYYYHSSSQWFQKLDLRYESQDTSCQFDFR